jgi:hypothetical protein
MDDLEVIDQDGFNSEHDIFYDQSLEQDERQERSDSILDKLKVVEKLVVEKYQSKIVCIFMYDKLGTPFLKVRS